MDGWLGLDVGTSSTKAVVYAGDGRQLAAARVPTAWQVRDGLVDIDPLALRAGAIEAAHSAAGQLATGVSVRGIGIASMGETGVLVDGAGTPVAPAIAWHDQRDHLEVEQLEHDLPTFAQRAGKPVRGQWSLTKHRWLREHVPDSRRAVRRFNVAEWVALGLGAEQACDRTLACRTGWFDLFAGTWWPQALEWSGASAELMPPLTWSGEPIGTMPVSTSSGALAGAVLTLAGHDHQAAAVGAGAGAPGAEFDSCGTAEALIRTVAPTLTQAQVGTLAAAGITTDASVRREHWSLLGGTEGGLAMERVLRMLGVRWPQLPQLDALAHDVGGADHSADVVGTDHSADVVGTDHRADVVGTDHGAVTVGGIGTAALTVSGISDDTGPGQVWRAVVDAATRQAAALHAAMSAVVGPHTRLVAAGGWCASSTVLDAKRRAFGEVAVSPVAECGTFGAAILAARAAGALGSDDRLGE